MKPVKYIVYYMYRQNEYQEEFNSVVAAFNFVDEMENGRGGYAFAIYKMNQPVYTRHINEETGTAYWRETETTSKFGNYFKYAKHRR